MLVNRPGQSITVTVRRVQCQLERYRVTVLVHLNGHVVSLRNLRCVIVVLNLGRMYGYYALCRVGRLTHGHDNGLILPRFIEAVVVDRDGNGDLLGRRAVYDWDSHGCGRDSVIVFFALSGRPAQREGNDYIESAWCVELQSDGQ